MRHTSGPWFAIAYANYWMLQSVDEYSDSDNLFDEEKNPNAEANAQLAASAPELLKACQEMVKHLLETDFDVCGTKDEDMNRWEAAIRKASFVKPNQFL